MSRLGKWRFVFIPLLWLLAIGGAMLLDSLVTRYVHYWRIDRYMRTHKPLQQAMEVPGEYWFTAAVMLGMLLHPLRWRASLLVLISTGLIGVNGVIKWGIGRFRPYRHFDEMIRHVTPFDFHPFARGIPGLFGETPNVCMPSGHTALAFATAAAASILTPRGRWAFYGLASIVAVERVLENAHWLSDVIAGAGMGVGAVWLARTLVWNRLSGIDRHGLALPLTGDPRLQRAGECPHTAQTG